MKIVIVIDSWNKGNGCIVATHRLVEQLQKRGHEVSLVTTSGKELSNFKGSVYTVPGFYLPGVKQSMINMEFLFGRGKKKTYAEAFKGADIVQIQLPYFMARNAVRTAKKMKIPVLGACHIQSQNMTGAMGKDNKVMDWFFNSWFNFELFKKVDAIHCPSEFAADLIISKGSKSHYRVISNGIPDKYVSIDNLERPKEWGDKFVLMNVGRHAMEKKQELMIDAVKKSKYKDDIQLLIFGKGEMTEHLKTRGKELPIEPRVEYISDDDKLHYLNTADMYFHTSGVELESLSCLEALGCGLPCFIEDSPNSATSMFALDEKFLFTNQNIDDIAAKIDFWYENRQLLDEYRSKTLEFAKRYRMEYVIRSMEDLYNDVIKQTREKTITLPKGEKIIA